MIENKSLLTISFVFPDPTSSYGPFQSSFMYLS